MILIDTSILIGYFKGLKGEPYDKLDNLIDQNIPVGICNQVYQEVLQGAKDEKAQTAIDNNLLLFHNDKDFVQISQIIPDLKLL